MQQWPVVIWQQLMGAGIWGWVVGEMASKGKISASRIWGFHSLALECGNWCLHDSAVWPWGISYLWRFYPRWYLLLSFKERKWRMIHGLTTNCDYVSPHLQDLCLSFLRWMLSNCGLRNPPGVHTCTVAVNPAAVAFGLSGLWKNSEVFNWEYEGEIPGRTICTGGEDGSFRVWNPRTGESTRVVQGQWSTYRILCLN